MQQMYANLLAAIARQAVHDLHSGYTHPRHMDAGAWLEAAGPARPGRALRTTSYTTPERRATDG